MSPQVHDYNEVSEIPGIINDWFEKRFPTRRRDDSRERGGRGRRNNSRDRGVPGESKRSVQLKSVPLKIRVEPRNDDIHVEQPVKNHL